MNISDLFSNLNYNNYSQIKQNPTSVVRTPIQEAYDNLLNREYEINKQNKTNNLVNGLMSGMGGLGKIIASAVVKNPMQQYGAMKGLTEQEGRIDNLQQAYNQARQKQNQDYVQQAKEQLGLATAEDERKFNREQSALDRAYKKAIDERNFANTIEQQNIANQLNQDKLDFAKEQAEQEREQREKEFNEKVRQFNETMGYNKDKDQADTLLKQQDEAKKEQDKQRQEQLKTYVATARDLFNKGYLSNEDLMAIEKNPELGEALIPKKRTTLGIPIPWTKNPKKMKIDRDSFTVMKDSNGNMAKVYKDGRIEEL